MADLKILDVSYSQQLIDYAAAAKEVDGVIIRCGRTLWGSFQPGADSCWEKHYKGFKATGIPVGAYYYGAAKNVAQARQEAAECIRLLAGKKLELPIWYDVEEQNTQGGLSKAALTEVVETFCKALEDAGYFAGFYTMLSWAQTKLDYPSLARQFASWIAWTSGDPRTRLSPTPAAWQYSWRERVSGIASGVDMSHFFTDYAAIIPAQGFNGYETGSKPDKPAVFVPYTVRVKIKDLRIRKGPGTSYPSAGYIAPAVYTIVEEADGPGATKWGKLKSGAGWISLDYVKKL